MKTYKSYTIQDNSEILIGLLSIYPFESFEELESSMIAYIPEDECTEENTADIHETITRFGTTYEIATIKPQNWNAIWESNFEPVIVDDFCVVRADFHDPIDNIVHDIIINPKMAFGTGHHETTYMMMSAMRDIDHTGKTVFDYGCGTGVLSVLAAKLDSGAIDAIDIEEESYDNTVENADINKVTSINAACATLETFHTKSGYDIILANINRQVLLDSASALYGLLNQDGIILLSGILEEDVKLVTDKYNSVGFKVVSEFSRGYWKCLKLIK